MQVQELIATKNWPKLHAYDELLREVGAFNVLSDWKTIQCDFAPTFKVSRCKPTEEYNPKRVPSYTDRILFKSFPGFRDKLDTFAYVVCECASLCVRMRSLSNVIAAKYVYARE